MPAAKKYTLFSSKNGEKAPCAFFASPSGCRNGDGCKFAHVLTEGGPAADKASPDMGSVVSSESSSSEDQGKTPFVSPKVNEEKSAGAAADSKKKKRRRSKKSSDDLPFAKPKTAAVKTTTPPPANSEETPFVNPKKRAKKETKKAEAPKEASGHQNEPKVDNNKVVDFRSLNLPIASFTMPGMEKETPKPAPKPPASHENPPHPSSPEAQKWAMCLEKTRSHPRYATSFDFNRCKAACTEIGIVEDWVKAGPLGPQHQKAPATICMDCEMCETQDPVTGKRDPRALSRISVIDAGNGEVLLDTLVKPDWPVVDARTWINGISEDHLLGVEFTLRHAQEFMMALCSEETVILGHAVHNDLAAIRMEHYCVVDSACLFEAADSPRAAVSLKDLSLAILKKPMPNKHDSVNDARVTLACLEHYREKEGKVEPIQRSAKDLKDKCAKQLFIHRIPKNLTDTHLAQMFTLFTDIQPSEVESIDFGSNGNGKTTVNFRSERHANLAFDTLEGKPETEASGRLQKKVYLRDGNYIRVRKMAFEKKRDESLRRSSTS